MSEQCVVSPMALAAAWNLQGDPARQAFVDEVGRQFAIVLPVKPNTSVRGDALTALWLGARSWLLIADAPASPLATFAEQRDALNDAGGALFDLSASRIAFRIAGPRATDVIASHCPLDLHPRAFRAGDCAQSMLGRINALLHKQDDVPTFAIMVARSFARDAWRSLCESAAQYDDRVA